MDKPLTKWYCDVCGQQIDDVERGYVIWKTTNESKWHGFKIIHQTKCDPDDYNMSLALHDFLGESGLTILLSQLSIGPIKKRKGQKPRCRIADMDEFVDFVRRVQTPFYEEARRYFSNHDLLEKYSDANEVFPYLPEQLEEIIKHYGERH